MKFRLLLAFMAVAITAQAQPKSGKWIDTTKDTTSGQYFSFSGGKLLLTEEYEVLQTHEVCASVTGYFLEKSQIGQYTVEFKGMRTSARFTFTDQYDAEKWAEKFCTPESLRY